MKVNGRRIAAAVVAVAVVLLAPYIFLFGKDEYRSVREYLHRIPFNSSSWQDPKQAYGQDPVRIRMVDDLMHSKQLDHLSRAEVEKLLGTPPRTVYFREYDLVYWLGPERGFISIDSEWLVIKFDSKEIVQKYVILRD
jgi:hypothetical protein